MFISPLLEFLWRRLKISPYTTKRYFCHSISFRKQLSFLYCLLKIWTMNFIFFPLGMQIYRSHRIEFENNTMPVVAFLRIRVCIKLIAKTEHLLLAEMTPQKIVSVVKGAQKEDDKRCWAKLILFLKLTPSICCQHYQNYCVQQWLK